MMIGKLRTALVGLLVVSTVSAQIAPEKAPTGRFEYARDVMGTRARVVIHADEQAAADAAIGAVWQRLDELDAILSSRRDDSEVNALSRRAGGPAVPLSPELYDVLWVAHQLAKLSDGAFDPTIGPFVELWRAAEATGVPPDDEQLATAAVRVGWRKLLIDRQAKTARLLAPGMLLDLDGIARGYAAQQALAALEDLDLSHALVDLGSDIAAGRQPDGGPAWPLEIDGGPGRQRSIKLLQTVVSVSLLDEPVFMLDGRPGFAVLDPRTGRPVSRPIAVVVVAREGAWAAGLASALSVLGPRAGRQLVDQSPASTALFIDDLRLPPMTLLHDEQGLDDWVVGPGENARWIGIGPWIAGVPTTAHGFGRIRSVGAYQRWALEAMVQRVGDMAPYIMPRDEGDDPARTVLLGRSGKWHHFELRLTGFDGQLAIWRDGRPLEQHGMDIAGAGPAPFAFGFAPSQEASDGGSVNMQGPQLRALGLFDEGLFDDRGDGRLELTDAGRAAGWADLLGDDLSRWQAPGGGAVDDGYRLEQGVLAIPSSGGTDLVSVDDYTDFRLRFEFRLSPGTNSGLFLRGARGGGDPAYSGCEVQIIDDHNWERLAGSALKPTQQCGSLYAAVPAAAPGALRPAGEWNTYEVLYQGSRLAVALNGTILYDVDTLTLDAKPPFADRAPRGFLGLQRYGAPHVEADVTLWVRNAFVQALPDK